MHTAHAVEVLSSCTICSGKLRTVLTEPDSSLEQLTLQRCESCGVVQLNPRLAQAAMQAMENASTVYDLPPGEVEQIVSGPLSHLVGYLSSLAPTHGRRWLDIGCNRGMLLEAARRKGWQVYGVEIADQPAKRARDDFGLDVRPAIEDFEDELPFDVVTAWHVLEHAYDPLALLRAAKDKLVQGGVLALQVPSYDHLEAYRARGQAGSLLCAVHNFYFTEEGLAQVLARTGLQVLSLTTDAEALLLTAICTQPQPAPMTAARPMHRWGERMRSWLRRH